MKNLQEKLNKYDNQLIYISGYHNCYSKVKCYCKRCNNYFERKWCNITRHTTEYSCPICQKELGQEKSITNRNNVYIIPLEEREEHFKKIIEKTQPTIKYISGFKNSKSHVLVECKICGDRFTRTVDMLTRKNRNVYCYNCERIKSKPINEMKRKQRQIIKQHIKEIQQYKKQQKDKIKKIGMYFKSNTIYMKKCIVCNDIFMEHTRSNYCSRCRKKIHHKHSQKSLLKLYKKDNGICYLCGGICNWNDKQEINGTIIVGDSYPSIDHVIPLSKGGTDDWNNLKLAHFKCNWQKG